MKGIVFNILDRIITEHYGEDGWDAVLDRANVDGAYASPGIYDDVEFMALVDSVAITTGRDTASCLRWIGREMLPHFERVYHDLVERYTDSVSMLAALNDVIHPEVTKLYPGSVVPVFHYHEIRSQRIIMEYDSRRGLCSMAHGLILGTADRFGEALEVEHTECRHRGDGRCIFIVTVTAHEN